MTTSPLRPSWFEQANCRSDNANLVATFYPSKTQVVNENAVAKAKAFCAACPVRPDCLEHAVINNEDWGIWGGTTLDERRAIKRARRRLRRERT